MPLDVVAVARSANRKALLVLALFVAYSGESVRDQLEETNATLATVPRSPGLLDSNHFLLNVALALIRRSERVISETTGLRVELLHGMTDGMIVAIVTSYSYLLDVVTQLRELAGRANASASAVVDLIRRCWRPRPDWVATAYGEVTPAAWYDWVVGGGFLELAEVLGEATIRLVGRALEAAAPHWGALVGTAGQLMLGLADVILDVPGLLVAAAGYGMLQLSQPLLADVAHAALKIFCDGFASGLQSQSAAPTSLLSASISFASPGSPPPDAYIEDVEEEEDGEFASSLSDTDELYVEEFEESLVPLNDGWEASDESPTRMLALKDVDEDDEAEVVALCLDANISDEESEGEDEDADADAVPEDSVMLVFESTSTDSDDSDAPQARKRLFRDEEEEVVDEDHRDVLTLQRFALAAFTHDADPDIALQVAKLVIYRCRTISSICPAARSIALGIVKDAADFIVNYLMSNVDGHESGPNEDIALALALYGELCMSNNYKTRVKNDPVVADSYLGRALDRGHVPAYLLRGHIREISDPDGAQSEYHCGADRGDVRCMVRLSEIYRDGLLGLSVDALKSAQWLHMAAQAENSDTPDGPYLYSLLLERASLRMLGKLIPKTTNRAVEVDKYRRKAAEIRARTAQLYLSASFGLGLHPTKRRRIAPSGSEHASSSAPSICNFFSF